MRRKGGQPKAIATTNTSMHLREHLPMVELDVRAERMDVCFVHVHAVGARQFLHVHRSAACATCHAHVRPSFVRTFCGQFTTRIRIATTCDTRARDCTRWNSSTDTLGWPSTCPGKTTTIHGKHAMEQRRDMYVCWMDRAWMVQ